MINEILKLFGFTEQAFIIGAVSVLMLSGCFLGGLLNGIILAHGGPIRPRPFFDRMSVRGILLAELFIGVFALYYHGLMIESIKASHMVFWAFSLVGAPVLAFIGAQITGLIFSKKIADNKRAYLIWLKAQRQNKKGKGKEPDGAKSSGSAQRGSRSFDPSAAKS